MLVLIFVNYKLHTENFEIVTRNQHMKQVSRLTHP